MVACGARPELKNINLTGVVLNEKTNKPIVDVLVYAQWISYHAGGGFGHGSSWRECQKAELYLTNRSGKFQFDDVIGSTGRIGKASIYLYKPGYEIKTITNENVGVVRLKKSNMKGRERIGSLHGLLNSASCFGQFSEVVDSRRKEAKKLVNAIFNELHKYVYTEEDIKIIISNYCHRMAELELDSSLVKNSGWSGEKDKRGIQIREYINNNYKKCDIKHLQDIRKNNLHALIFEKNTEFVNRAKISGCVVKKHSDKEKRNLMVNGNGIFYIKNKNYLGDSAESVYIPLRKFRVAVLNPQKNRNRMYGLSYSRNKNTNHYVDETVVHLVRDKVVNIKRNKNGYPLSADFELSGMSRMIVKSRNKYVDFKEYLDKEKYYSSYKRLVAKKFEVLKRLNGTLECGL